MEPSDVFAYSSAVAAVCVSLGCAISGIGDTLRTAGGGEIVTHAVFYDRYVFLSIFQEPRSSAPVGKR